MLVCWSQHKFCCLCIIRLRDVSGVIAGLRGGSIKYLRTGYTRCLCIIIGRVPVSLCTPQLNLLYTYVMGHLSF